MVQTTLFDLPAIDQEEGSSQILKLAEKLKELDIPYTWKILGMIAGQVCNISFRIALHGDRDLFFIGITSNRSYKEGNDGFLITYRHTKRMYHGAIPSQVIIDNLQSIRDTLLPPEPYSKYA